MQLGAQPLVVGRVKVTKADGTVVEREVELDPETAAAFIEHNKQALAAMSDKE